MKKNLLISAFFLSVAAHAQWTTQATGFPAPSTGIIDVCAVNGNVVWAASYEGTGAGTATQDFTRTTDGGNTWIAGVVPAPSTYAFSNLWAVDANTAWACLHNTTAGGGISKTSNGGATWSQQGGGVIYNAASFPNFVYFSNTLLGITVGDPNGGYFEIYTTLDGGTTWTRVPQANIPANLSGEIGWTNVFDVEGTTIWFGTSKGRIYKSVNAGLNWTVSTTSFASVDDIVMINANDGLIQGGALISKTTDGCATVTPVSVSSGNLYTNDIEAIPNSSTYVSTGATNPVSPTNQGSSYSLDAGTTWIEIDNSVQHLAQGWVDGTTGWCGGFNTDQTTGGIFKFAGSPLVGVTALNNDNSKMNIFPNPSNGQFNLQIAGAETKNATVKIVDVVGNVVYENNIGNSSNVIVQNVDISTASKGVYFVTVENGTTRFVKKIVVE